MVPYNKKFRTRYYFNGGKITAKNMSKEMKSRDAVKAILQAGEIVIPKVYAKAVTKLLRTNNIKLPNL